MPLMICIAPLAIVCSPDEQKRLIVCAGTSTGNPARSALESRDVQPLRRFRHRAAPGDVVDRRRVDADALDGLLHHERGQLDRMRRRERAVLLALRHGGRGGHDHDVVLCQS